MNGKWKVGESEINDSHYFTNRGRSPSICSNLNDNKILNCFVLAGHLLRDKPHGKVTLSCNPDYHRRLVAVIASNYSPENTSSSRLRPMRRLRFPDVSGFSVSESSGAVNKREESSGIYPPWKSGWRAVYYGLSWSLYVLDLLSTSAWIQSSRHEQLITQTPRHNGNSSVLASFWGGGGVSKPTPALNCCHKPTEREEQANEMTPTEDNGGTIVTIFTLSGNVIPCFQGIDPHDPLCSCTCVCFSPLTSIQN